jgi:uncharacterized protein (TIGR00251 family)
MIKLMENAGAIRFALKVVPGASRDRVAGALGDALKVAVSKPPQDGQANAAVVKLLAAELGLGAAQITITRGHGSPRKEISITGASIADLEQRLQRFG